MSKSGDEGDDTARRANEVGDEATLYERLGGRESIAAVVDRFYERVMDDDRLVRFFEDVDMERQRAHQTQFLSAVTGGPVDYDGESMREAHDHLDITEEDFAAIATHLEDTLQEFYVGERERREVLTEFGSYEEEIVSASPST